jgi:hypothetical protein
MATEKQLLEALRSALTPRALHVLDMSAARFDLGSRCEPREFTEVLAGHGASASPEIIRAEAALGGLQFDGDDPYRFGVYSMLVARERRDPWVLSVDVAVCAADESRLLPFALGGGADARHFIASDGRIWFRELICMRQPIPEAKNARVFLERVLRTCDPVRPRFPYTARVWAHIGQDLASSLNVPFVAEASDSVERVWENHDVLIAETPDWQFLIDPLDPDQAEPEPIMDVRSRTYETHKEVVRVLKTLRPEVRLEASD